MPNNAILLCKEIQKKSGGISIRAIANRGLSEFGEPNYFNILLATSVVGFSGLGPMNHFEFQEFLQNNGLSITPFIDESSIGVNAYCESAEKLELLLNLIRLYFSSPKFDGEAFQNFKTNNAQFLSNQRPSSKQIFYDSIDSIINLFSPQPVQMKLADLATLDIDQMRTYYQNEFGSAGNFIFIVVGNFQTKRIMSVLTSCIASLPDSGVRLSLPKREGSLPNNLPETRRIHSAISDDSQVQFRLLMPCTPAQSSLFACQFLKYLIEEKLTQRLRKESGAVYAVQASLAEMKVWEGLGDLNISYSCSPNNLETAINITEEALKELATVGVELDSYKAIQKFLIQDYGKWQYSTSWWIQNCSALRNNIPLLEKLSMLQDQLLQLNYDEINTILKALLANSKTIKFIFDTSPVK